ncbi:bacteriohemerythrin [Desulfovibrio inopinatus]|uniref:bacteriohemerythrin n=1 Tax=Desulfovibrio inopinatus TaxID=102109 RepID=UPI00041A37C0|nr:bacteriohemerythrin [Desulfovibrio inopinatus]
MENESKRRSVQILFAVVFVIAAGTVGYMLIEEGWSFLDALYMTIITITTIGYGEVHSLTPAGRVFTMGLIFCGLGLAAVFATQVARMIVESGVRNLYEKRRIRDKVLKLNHHSIVCGYGTIGRAVALKLHEMRLPFVIVDIDEAHLAEAGRRGYLTAHGDAASDGVLLNVGIRKAKTIVLCINDDASNINIALAARELHPDIYIVARGSNPDIEYRMIRAGANTVVYPLALGGEQIAHILARETGHGDEVSAVEPSETMGYGLRIYRHMKDVPITVAEAMVLTKAAVPVAVARQSGERLTQPAPDVVLEKEDCLVAAAQCEETTACGFECDIKWTDDLLLGIPAIDAEHRVLVKYAEDFQQAVQQGQGREALSRLFDRLLEYTAGHFAREETFMRKMNYPDIEEHIREHRRITGEVMQLNRDKSYVFPANVGSFLEDWIVGHISQRDRKYAEVYREK